MSSCCLDADSSLYFIDLKEADTCDDEARFNNSNNELYLSLRQMTSRQPADWTLNLIRAIYVSVDQCKAGD